MGRGEGIRTRKTARLAGIRRPVKVFAVCMVVTVVSLSITFGPLPVWLKWVVGGLALVGIGTIVFLVPTIKSAPRP